MYLIENRRRKNYAERVVRKIAGYVLSRLKVMKEVAKIR